MVTARNAFCLGSFCPCTSGTKKVSIDIVADACSLSPAPPICASMPPVDATLHLCFKAPG